MINIGNKGIIGIYSGNIPIISAYLGNILLWSSKVESCFALGYWQDEYPWTDNLQWID